MIGTIKKLIGRKKRPEIKPSRNEPCWCGSSKKYKRCCLEKDQIAIQTVGKKGGSPGGSLGF